ncbi:Zn-dependent hydrolase [Marinobacterium iners]|uniref:Zn-dependent hydrolase n=1 Tax=Marinobacterium iners TaxID=48076 RepID=UPI001A9046EC|nr:Zn-dependent hydrolase [Marinobacterium iners]
MSYTLSINGTRLQQRLKVLGEYGALPGGGVSRLALTDTDRQGRDCVVGWMRELGLEISIDQFGNVVGRRAGLEDGPAVMTGSHIDTVSTGGLYDGNLGVLAGLEVIETLNDAGIQTRKPLAVAFFTNEEGARFAPDMMGSCVFTGVLDLETALATEGIDGTCVGDELARIGYRGDAPVNRASEQASAFVELHIEQGPILEQDGVRIGAVEGVQGISWTEFVIRGTSNHAGTTPMNLRQDAALVAAEITVFVRQLADRMGGRQLATVGHCEYRPNLVNVIPNLVTLTVDLRNTDEALLQQAEAELFAFVNALSDREGVKISQRSLARFEPVVFDAELVARIDRIAREQGNSVMRLPSGAGHDAQMFAPICPTAMIFVPSADGISHNVREHTDSDDLEAGANVLLQTLLELAEQA